MCQRSEQQSLLDRLDVTYLVLQQSLLDGSL